MANSVCFVLAVRTISEANRRGHWAKYKKLHDEQKFMANIMTRRALLSLRPYHPLRIVGARINIKMVRFSTGRLDSDNLQGAEKYVRDAIANVLEPGHRPGMADGGDRLSWSYAQAKGKARQHRTEVTLSLAYPKAP